MFRSVESPVSQKDDVEGVACSAMGLLHSDGWGVCRVINMCRKKEREGRKKDDRLSLLAHMYSVHGKAHMHCTCIPCTSVGVASVAV